MICNYKYVTPQGEEGLKAYTYHGADYSLLYKYILSPWAQWLVDTFVPESMAPNLITLIGFICSIIPHVIIVIQADGGLGGPIPGWTCILAGVCTFAYSTLDNMDGKQARKTKTSSPLGLLFDHGCDALNVTITGLSFFTVLQLGNTLTTMMAFGMGVLAFYTATWEEYYTNGLYLPIVNGASEGVIVTVSLFIFSGIIGNDFWLKASPIGGIQWNMLLFYSTIGLAVFSALSNIYNIIKKASDKLWRAIGDLAPLMLLFLTMAVSFFFVKSPGQYMRYRLYFFGLNFGKIMTHMQIAHCANEDFNGFQPSTTLMYISYITITLLQHFLNKTLIEEGMLLMILLGISVIVYLHLAFNVINQFTNVLKIRAFSIKPQERQHLFK